MSADQAAASATKIGGTGPSSQRMKGANNFVRHNPKSDRFNITDFDHVEIWCTDAKSTAGRLCACFGLHQLAISDIDNGCFKYTAIVVGSYTIKFVVVAPYFTDAPLTDLAAKYQDPLPTFDKDECMKFIARHGNAGRAIGLHVDDAAKAFAETVAHGGKPALAPTTFKDENGEVTYTEVFFYDDVKFRFMQYDRKSFKGAFLPGFKNMPATLSDGSEIPSFNLRRIDHIVSNVPNLCELSDKVTEMMGLHEFGEFTAEDVGTVDSGLNSMVMANNAETVLMPINEPTTGTRRKSQIQSFLEHHKGPGIQHIAITTPDIISTVAAMQKASANGGVTFMAHPGKDYYESHVPRKMQGIIPQSLIDQCNKYGVLIDRDEEGTLLQIFTKPIFDRPTLFVEIIQRVGCMQPDGTQKPACGGFGKGNFGALFKSIEDWEKQRDGEVPAQEYL